MQTRVLIIAGSDSGGGAGIQADIKTVTALGGFAMTAITALTAQNTLGVHAIEEVSPEFVYEQMRVVLQDIGADCIKTGMLHRVEIVEAVERGLADFAGDIPLVVDPVMVAKGGASLLSSNAVAAIIEKIVPRATVLTPNAPEAAALSGMAVESREDAMEAALNLAAMGPQAVLVKGGHIDEHNDTLSDILLHGGQTIDIFESTRIKTVHTHGTGCTLASAIAAGLADGLAVKDAVVRAREYVHAAIATAPGFGGGHGPLNHAHPVHIKG
jgi:hydroxymethylpyrimidine/phosphomethylpyrimidine kinase